MSRLLDLANRIDPRGQSWHPRLIRNLASALSISSYLEIGIYRCETLRVVAKVAETVVGVDIDQKALDSAPRRSNIATFLGTAQEYAASSDVGRFDLIFIDANHSRDHVAADFAAVEPLLTQKGIILLHDTWPGSKEFADSKFCGDAYLAVHELRLARPEFNFVTITQHPGLTLCQKVGILPDWTQS